MSDQINPQIEPTAPNQSATIGKLASALAKAQTRIEGAKKDSENPYFKSSYADLSSVWEACHKALNENEIAIIQLAESGVEHVTVTTMLAHSSGEWIKSTFSLAPKMKDPQGMGSALTYARRYALAAITGVCPIDDDGEAAMQRPVAKPAPAKTPAPADKPTPYMTEAMRITTREAALSFVEDMKAKGASKIEVDAVVGLFKGKFSA